MLSPTGSTPPRPNSGREPGVLFIARVLSNGQTAFDIPANEAEELLDTTPEVLGRELGKCFSLPRSDDPGFWEAVRRMANDHAPWERAFVVRGQRTGREVCVRARAIPHREPSGAIVWAGLLLEVSDREAAEAHARHMDRELAAHLDNTPLAVIEWDRQGRAIRWSGQAEKVFGWAANEVLGRHALDCVGVHPDDLPTVSELIRETLAGRMPRSVSVNRNLTKAGAVIWCEWHNSVVLDDAGEVVSTLSLILDVTERRTAGEELARREAWLRATLSNARMLGWGWDFAARRVSYSNDPAAFFDLPTDRDYTDKSNAWLAVHPDDIPRITAITERAVATGDELSFEHRGRSPGGDGRERWFTTRGQVLRGPDGSPTGLFAITADTTDQKYAKQERETLDRQLLDAQKWESLGVLAGGVAHDFNNILTIILGNASLAHRVVPFDSPARDYLTQIEEASQRAADLCRQMLSYAGRGPAPTGRADLNQVVRESGSLLDVSSAGHGRVRFDLAADLPLLRADAAQLRQVLINLVMNAGEAVGAGGRVTVRTATVSVPADESPAGYRLVPAPGQYVLLEVSDNGPGISPDVEARMFDPFFTTRFPGRGLGLAAALGIVRTHRGGMRVVTAPGRGTTVAVLWPFIEGTVAAPAPVRSAASSPDPPTGGAGVTANPARSPAARESPDRPGEVALVVDDEIFIREVAASTLEDMGYRAVLAEDGPSGLDLFRQHQGAVRVVVVDVVMPGMAGDQVVEAIRALVPDLPAVLMSGYVERRVLGPFGPGTRTEFLQKPFRPEELAAAVQRVVATPTA